MRKPIDIDRKTSCAIVREIGEGLRASLKGDKDLPAELETRIERLRQSEGEPQPNAARMKPRQSK
jgi:hypothetical protein